MEYIGYHGTNEISATKLISREFKKVPIISSELRKQGNVQLPGSLGYGLYIFNSDPELAEEFSQKFNSDTRVVQVKIEINEEEIFDLDELEQMKKLREYYKLAIKNIERNMNGKRINNKKQNIFDGILLEHLFMSIKKIKEVKAVKMATHTFLDSDDTSEYVSRVHNGQELCIRDYIIIKDIMNYNLEEKK